MKSNRSFFVTGNTHFYLFDETTGKFTMEPESGDPKQMKSVDEHPESGRVVFYEGSAENWWSETIRFRGSGDAIHIPPKRPCKVRRDVPM